jgi:hypothetical protein
VLKRFLSQDSNSFRLSSKVASFAVLRLAGNYSPIPLTKFSTPFGRGRRMQGKDFKQQAEQIEVIIPSRKPFNTLISASSESQASYI